MIIQIICSCLGALMAIGILALIFGIKSWAEKLIRERSDTLRDFREKLSGIQRRLDRVMESVEGLNERIEDNDKRDEENMRTE